MKKLFVLLFLFSAVFTANAQGVFLAIGGKVSFFSETPVENIDATTSSMTSVLTTMNREIIFTVPMRTFEFKKALMEEHFNENYVESEKFPNSTYKGKINEEIDWTKEGVYTVTSTGVLSLHGVDQSRTDTAKITIKEGKINLECTFNIKLKDHDIQIPKIVSTNIAEEVRITMNADYNPYKKAAK